MGILDIFRQKQKVQTSQPRAAVGETAEFYDFNDPSFIDFMRGGLGAVTQSGKVVTPQVALRNPTVLRCVSLLSFSIGMSPLHLQVKLTKENAKEHPLFKLLHRRPNSWQTAFEFRAMMQQRVLTDGDAVALKIKSGSRITQLIPLNNVTIRQNDDWSLSYIVSRENRPQIEYSRDDVFHVRNGLSENGFAGISCVRQAAEAIGLAQQAETATAKMFAKGMVIGGALKHKEKLSNEAYERLSDSMASKQGADKAHQWLILEEGMDMQTISAAGREGQGLEQRKHQIEEIARVFGVPRPLLMMDDTSWGSGIDVLGQMFVRYSLNPWFEAWQQAIERDLLNDADSETYETKFNAGALLRGSMKDQADFFAKGLGAGGHQPWLHPDEAREWMDLPQRDDLPAAAGAQKGHSNDPKKTA